MERLRQVWTALAPRIDAAVERTAAWSASAYQAFQAFFGYGKSAAAFVAKAADKFKSLIINVTVIAALVIVLVISYKEFNREEELNIEPFIFPKRLLDLGYSGQIPAYRIADQITAITTKSGTRRRPAWALAFSTTDVAAGEAGAPEPNTPLLASKIPDSNISLDSIVQSLRQYFSKEGMRVSGNFVCDLPGCSADNIYLRVTVRHAGRKHYIDAGKVIESNLDGYYLDVAEKILTHIDPYVLALYQIGENKADDGQKLLYGMISSNHRDKIWAHNSLGTYHSDRKEYDQALFHYKEALALNKDFAPAYISAGNVFKKNAEVCRSKNDRYSDMRYGDLAIANYKMAIQKAGKGSQGQYVAVAQGNWAGILVARGQDDAALKTLEQAVASGNGDLGPLILLGNIHFRKKDWNKAAYYYHLVASSDSGNYSANYNLGLVSAQLNDHLRAAEFFERAHKKEPNSKPALDRWAASLKRLGYNERAEAITQTAANPDIKKGADSSDVCVRALADNYGFAEPD